MSHTMVQPNNPITTLNDTASVNVYYHEADLALAQQHPPSYVNAIDYQAAGKIYCLSKKQRHYTFHEADFIAFSKYSVICFPGVNAIDTINQVLVNQTTLEIFNQHIFSGNYHEFMTTANSIGLYKPKYNAGERYYDLLEFYKNENFIAREAQHIAESILLPLIFKGNNSLYLLKGFSLGAHELKMAFNAVISYLQRDNFSELAIAARLNKFVIYNTGASINWSTINPIQHLYPKTITLLALEDQGIKHLQRTFIFLAKVKNLLLAQPTLQLIARTKNTHIHEIIAIAPLNALPITEQDNSHNIKSYSMLTQNSSLIREFLRNALVKAPHRLNPLWNILVLHSCEYASVSNQVANFNQVIHKIPKFMRQDEPAILYDNGSVIHITLANLKSKFYKALASIHHLNPYDATHIKHISDVASQALLKLLPASVLATVTMIRAKSSYRRRFIVLHGCPVGNSPTIDKDEQLNFQGFKEYTLHYFILGISQLLGCAPIIDNNIQSGAVIANIYPKMSFKQKYNANSPEEFQYHNETVHKEAKPDLFILACNQQQPTLQVTTSFILTKDLLQILPKWVITALSTAPFDFTGGDVVNAPQHYQSSIISYDANSDINDFRLNLNFKRMIPHTPEGAKALQYITTVIKQHLVKQYDINFKAGMVVIADNNSSIHMRSSFDSQVLAANQTPNNITYPLRLLYRLHLKSQPLE